MKPEKTIGDTVNRVMGEIMQDALNNGVTDITVNAICELANAVVIKISPTLNKRYKDWINSMSESTGMTKEELQMQVYKRVHLDLVMRLTKEFCSEIGNLMESYSNDFSIEDRIKISRLQAELSQVEDAISEHPIPMFDQV